MPSGAKSMPVAQSATSANSSESVKPAGSATVIGYPNSQAPMAYENTTETSENASVPAIFPPYTTKNEVGAATTSSRVPRLRSWLIALDPAKSSTDHNPDSAAPTTT